MANHAKDSAIRLERFSEEQKKFFSAGGSFSVPACAIVVKTAWSALELLSAYCKSPWAGLALAAIVVFAYAYLLPEPEGYADVGKRKLTRSELFFGVINTFVVFGTAASFRCLHL
jgi:hypothetical protein